MTSNLPQLQADRMAVRLLRELWQASVNARFEFQTAMGFVKDEHLSHILRDLIETRDVFTRELRGAIDRFGIPVTRPPVRLYSRVHALWTQLSSNLSRDPEMALLREIERLEKGDLNVYDYVLSEAEVLPLSMLEMVRHQRERIRAEVARIQENEMFHSAAR